MPTSSRNVFRLIMKLLIRPVRLTLSSHQMNALSRREEEALLKTTKARALKECDPLVKEFADCASGRTISVSWACREKLNLVQECMVQFTGPEAMEKVRMEYLRLRNEQNHDLKAVPNGP